MLVSDPNRLLDSIENDTERVAGKLSITGICRDPKDDKLLACAVEGNADYIVTGDIDILDIGSYKGVKIVTPKDFLALKIISDH